jgi:hypothetical protein
MSARRGIEEVWHILTGRTWSVREPFYDFIQSIRFDAAGGGELRYGYAQAMRILVRFSFRLVTPGRMRCAFLKTENVYPGLKYRPTDASRQHELPFDLTRGEYLIEEYLGMGVVLRTYRYRLRFGAEPFPADCHPDDQDLEYYGWPT